MHPFKVLKSGYFLFWRYVIGIRIMTEFLQVC